MSSSSKRALRFSLQTLGRKVSFAGLPHVESVFLLQMLIGVSQALNGSAARAEALARALVFDGQRRLSRLRRAAPHLSLSLDQLVRMARSDAGNDEELSAEESAVQALLEVCLGLVLQLLSRGDRGSSSSGSSASATDFFSFDVRFTSVAFPLIFPLRARACLIS